MLTPEALTSWPRPALPPMRLFVPEPLKLSGFAIVTPPLSSRPAPQPPVTVAALVTAPRAAEFASCSVPAETFMPLTQAAGLAAARTRRPLSFLMIWVVALTLAKPAVRVSVLPLETWKVVVVVVWL